MRLASRGRAARAPKNRAMLKATNSEVPDNRLSNPPISQDMKAGLNERWAPVRPSASWMTESVVMWPGRLAASTISSPAARVQE
jgi:hypothetical protein